MAARLFMESLEDAHFLKIIGRESIWLRYVDDVLAVVPNEIDLQMKLKQLKSVHPSIKFTKEVEKEGKMAFWDTCIVKTSNGFKFKSKQKTKQQRKLCAF